MRINDQLVHDINRSNHQLKLKNTAIPVRSDLFNCLKRLLFRARAHYQSFDRFESDKIRDKLHVAQQFFNNENSTLLDQLQMEFNELFDCLAEKFIKKPSH